MGDLQGNRISEGNYVRSLFPRVIGRPLRVSLQYRGRDGRVISPPTATLTVLHGKKQTWYRSCLMRALLPAQSSDTFSLRVFYTRLFLETQIRCQIPAMTSDTESILSARFKPLWSLVLRSLKKKPHWTEENSCQKKTNPAKSV